MTCAHHCVLFFCDSVVTEGRPRDFFSGNSFHMTFANRMAWSLLPRAVMPEDVLVACGGTLFPEPALPEDIPTLPEPEENSPEARPQKLPWWRKLLAAASGLTVLVLFLKVLGVMDLTALVTQEGATALVADQLWLYGVMIAAMFVFALSITRRAHRPEYLVQAPKKKRKLTKRTLAATVLIPLTLYVDVFYLDNKKLLYLFDGAARVYNQRFPDLRGPEAPDQGVGYHRGTVRHWDRRASGALYAVPVQAGDVHDHYRRHGLRQRDRFSGRAMTMLVSNVLFGQGPMTPWQMFAMSIIGFLAGVIFRKGWLRRSRGSLSVFGALCAILFYGGIMNPASALTWLGELNGKIFLTYYISGFPFDCIQAAATWLFLFFGAEPMLEKLDRVKIKYGLIECP